VAMKGSPLGVGTDIDGSLRIPSAFCGLYTLRPSYERLPYYGAVNALEGQESISSVLGPMANTLSGKHQSRVLTFSTRMLMILFQGSRPSPRQSLIRIRG
jgi:hypothetical protein